MSPVSEMRRPRPAIAWRRWRNASCRRSARRGRRVGCWSGTAMGAKLAAIVARHAPKTAEPGLGGLEQLVLLAGSPPGPEPMQESPAPDDVGLVRRRRLVAGVPRRDGFVTQNIGSALHPERHALAGRRRLAWPLVRRGSPGLMAAGREDWADRVGVLRTPAMIVAGAEDGALGPDAQARFMAPHFAQHRLVTLDGAGHLLPLERAEEVARLIVEQAGSVGSVEGSGFRRLRQRGGGGSARLTGLCCSPRASAAGPVRCCSRARSRTVRRPGRPR